jgi:hypothetical protein
MEQADGHNLTESREAVHFAGQLGTIVRIKPKGESDQGDERAAFRQRFDLDPTAGRARCEEVDAAKRSGRGGERNLRCRPVEPYLPGIRGYLMASPDAPSKRICRIVPESQ